MPSIITSVEKGKRQALLKEGFQTISSIVQAGYLNGDFANITSWDIANQKGAGSIVDYFNQKLNAAYRCNTNDTTKGCGRNTNTTIIVASGTRDMNSTWFWNHNAVWIMPSKAMYWINAPSPNSSGILWNVTSDAYATDMWVGGSNPSFVRFFCNLSDTPDNTYSSSGASNVKPGMCSYLHGGLGN